MGPALYLPSDELKFGRHASTAQRSGGSVHGCLHDFLHAAMWPIGFRAERAAVSRGSFRVGWWTRAALSSCVPDSAGALGHVFSKLCSPALSRPATRCVVIAV